MSQRKKLIVIGGGASGFFCAINAARLYRNLDVVILEKSAKLLSKVRISGGGRCNVTHASEMVDDMLDAYPILSENLCINSPRKIPSTGLLKGEFP
jgi:hypothetical protein